MIKRFLFSVLIVGLSHNAFSYNTQLGNLDGYLPYSNGTKEIFFFKLDSTSASGCNGTNRYAIDSDHKNFKSVVSAVMASFHSKTPIRVRYEETCNTFSNAFDSSYICIGDIPC